MKKEMRKEMKIKLNDFFISLNNTLGAFRSYVYYNEEKNHFLNYIN